MGPSDPPAISSVRRSSALWEGRVPPLPLPPPGRARARSERLPRTASVRARTGGRVSSAGQSATRDRDFQGAHRISWDRERALARRARERSSLQQSFCVSPVPRREAMARFSLFNYAPAEKVPVKRYNAYVNQVFDVKEPDPWEPLDPSVVRTLGRLCDYVEESDHRIPKARPRARSCGSCRVSPRVRRADGRMLGCAGGRASECVDPPRLGSTRRVARGAAEAGATRTATLAGTGRSRAGRVRGGVRSFACRGPGGSPRTRSVRLGVVVCLALPTAGARSPLALPRFPRPLLSRCRVASPAASSRTWHGGAWGTRAWPSRRT